MSQGVSRGRGRGRGGGRGHRGGASVSPFVSRAVPGQAIPISSLADYAYQGPNSTTNSAYASRKRKELQYTDSPFGHGVVARSTLPVAYSYHNGRHHGAKRARGVSGAVRKPLTRGRSAGAPSFPFRAPSRGFSSPYSASASYPSRSASSSSHSHRSSSPYRSSSPSADSSYSQSSYSSFSSSSLPFASSSCPSLTADQSLAITIALEGVSFFFTGSAGTGKSYLLLEMVNQLRNKYREPDEVFITAPTGIAACNVGGITLHSFGGVGLAQESKEVLAAKVGRNKLARQRWQSVRVLIVDEVSMLDAAFFEKLEFIGRTVRRSQKPFGGIQVILCGDFFQLPPVSDSRTPDPKASQFCFESATWRCVIQRNIILRQVFRQSDSAFISLLNGIREGNLDDEGERLLIQAMIPFEKRGSAITAALSDIAATKLYPYRNAVEEENCKRLQELPGESIFFTAKDSGTPTFLAQLQRNCPATEKLELKIGAQVILLKNLSTELVNGSRGVVIDFHYTFNNLGRRSSTAYPEVLFTNSVKRIITPETWTVEVGGVVQATREQCPLALAWALSIHKSQGMSIAKVEIALGRVWEYGQAYVALSRATSLQGLHLKDWRASGIRAHPKVKAFYEEMAQEQS